MNRHFHNFLIAALLAALVGIAAPETFAQEDTATVSEVIASEEVAPVAQQKSYLDEEEGTDISDVPKMPRAISRVVVVMIFLFALLLGGLVIFQKISRKGLNFGGDSKRPLRVVDRVSVGPKSSVCLVQTCGKALVLGVSEKEITVLMDMDMNAAQPADKDFAGAMEQVSQTTGRD